MNTVLRIIPSCCLLPIGALAQATQAPATKTDPSVSQFLAGQFTKFTTRGRPKSNGAALTLKIPAGWSAREGERPHIIQKFVFSLDGFTDNIMVGAHPFPSDVPFGEDDAKEILAPAALKDSIPDGSTFVTATATKIEGVPAGLLEYSIRGERAGVQVSGHTIAFIFFQGRTMIRVECSTGSVSASPNAVTARFNSLRPLFQQVFNSILFDDKWK